MTGMCAEFERAVPGEHHPPQHVEDGRDVVQRHVRDLEPALRVPRSGEEEVVEQADEDHRPRPSCRRVTGDRHQRSASRGQRSDA